MSLEESFSRLENAIDALIARTPSADDGFRRGLTHGLLLALLMLRNRAQNVAAPAAPPAPARSRRASTPKPKPDQLDLFKP
jgi:hypothetical protein